MVARVGLVRRQRRHLVFGPGTEMGRVGNQGRQEPPSVGVPPRAAPFTQSYGPPGGGGVLLHPNTDRSLRTGSVITHLFCSVPPYTGCGAASVLQRSDYSNPGPSFSN